MTGPANAAGSAPQAIRPRSVTFTRLTLPAAQVTFGAEQGEKAAFTVSNLSGPAPLGTVSIFATGNGSSALLCSGTPDPLPGSLTFSAGSCGLGSSPLSPGSYDVAATYPGNTAQGNFASASQPQHLGVLQVTTTSPGLPDPQISVSQEQPERLIAQVLPVNGGAPAPSGSVTIKAGAAIICTTPPVFNGVAFCSPASRQLPAGSYQLTATFNGDADNAASISAPRALTVTP